MTTNLTVSGLRANMTALRGVLGRSEWEFKDISKGHSRQLRKDDLMYNRFVPYHLNKIIISPRMTCVHKASGRIIKIEMCNEWGNIKIDLGDGFTFEENTPLSAANKIKGYL